MAGQRAKQYDDLDPATLAVRDLIGASRQLVGRMAQLTGMNANDMSAIDALARHGPLGVADLADRLGIRSPSATVLVDRLERAGHVERLRDTVDRRRVTVNDTGTARQAIDEAWATTIDRIDETCRALPDSDREAVRRFLTQLTEVLNHSGHADR